MVTESIQKRKLELAQKRASSFSVAAEKNLQAGATDEQKRSIERLSSAIRSNCSSLSRSGSH